MNKYLDPKKYLSFLYRQSSPLLAKIDAKLGALAQSSFDDVKPVFILGTPRSGTTFAYQLMVKYFDFLYVSNVVEQFYATPNLAFMLNEKYFNQEKMSFDSTYGNTSADGAKAPNQGVNFWYQWFGLDNIKHYQTIEELDLKKLALMQSVIATLTHRYQKNMLFKQLSIGQKLPVINRYFPKAKYIIIERDMLYTAQSIHQAMSKTNTPPNTMWGGQFDGFEQYLYLPKNEMVANQVMGFHGGIEKGLAEIDNVQVLRINYQQMCLNLPSVLSAIADFTGMPLIEEVNNELPIRYSEKVSINPQDFEQIKLELQRIINR
jgi:hypothetical protein